MKNVILAAVVSTIIGAASAVPAQAFGPGSVDGLAPAAPIVEASAARERRLFMRDSIIRQQNMAARRGYGGGGYGGGYGRGYGGGGYGHSPYGPPAYGRRHRHGW